MGTRLRCDLHHSSAHVAYTDIVLTVGGELFNWSVSGAKGSALFESKPQQAGEIRIGPAASVNGGIGTVGLELGASAGKSINDEGISNFTNRTVTPTVAPVLPKISAEVKVNIIDVFSEATFTTQHINTGR